LAGIDMRTEETQHISNSNQYTGQTLYRFLSFH
jgi:hypothetical protein